MDEAKLGSQVSARRLLVVEDHPAMRTLLVDWLGAAFPQYQCAETGSGERAIDLVRNRPPTLVLMDYALPGINGIEATRRIRLIAPSVAVVLLSMHEAEAYQAEAAAAGASAFLYKRTMVAELIPTLRAILSRSSDEAAKRGMPPAGHRSAE